jgi:hypothetical protein
VLQHTLMVALLLLLLLLLSCAATGGLLLSCASQQQCGEASSSPYELGGQLVERVSWDSFLFAKGDGWREALMQRGEPLIFTGGVSADWAALRSWGEASHWAAQTDGEIPLARCYVSPRRDFRYYDRARPLAHHFSIAEIHRAEQITEVSLPAVELLEPRGADAPVAQVWRYCSIENLPTRMWAELANITAFELRPSEPAGSGDSFINVWAGDDGTIAHPHHDVEHNIYSVVLGEKRFHLFSPEEAVRLSPHPYAHPGGRQSQASFSSRDAKLFPALARSAARSSGWLSPGETIYVPPYWAHRVFSRGGSGGKFALAVNVWTNSAQHEDFGRLLHMALPIPADLPLRVRVGRVAAYLTAIENGLPVARRREDWEGTGRMLGGVMRLLLVRSQTVAPFHLIARTLHKCMDLTEAAVSAIKFHMQGRYRPGSALTEALLELAGS